MRIDLSNGYAEISEFWRWKHEQAYLESFYGEGETNGKSFVRAKVVMVKSLITKISIQPQGENEKIGGIELVDELEVVDFNKIYDVVNAIRDKAKPPTDKEKKSSEK